MVLTVAAYNREDCPREGELMTAAESTSTTAPKEAPMLPGDAEAHASTSADIAAARPPIITVMHASVGSGHKAAANAVAQAIDRLRGTHGIPNNVIVDVIDILDYGRIKFDGNKTAASFTGATRPCLQRVYREQAAHCGHSHAHHRRKRCRGRAHDHGHRLPPCVHPHRL